MGTVGEEGDEVSAEVEESSKGTQDKHPRVGPIVKKVAICHSPTAGTRATEAPPVPKSQRDIITTRYVAISELCPILGQELDSLDQPWPSPCGPWWLRGRLCRTTQKVHKPMTSVFATHEGWRVVKNERDVYTLMDECMRGWVGGGMDA